MQFNLNKHDKYTLMTLDEENIDTRIAPQLKSELVLLNSSGVRNIVLDIRQVKYADSSGLSAMLVGNRLCQSAGGSFAISGASDNVQKLIELSHLGDVLTVFDSAEAAIDQVFVDEIERDLAEETEESGDQPEA